MQTTAQSEREQADQLAEFIGWQKYGEGSHNPTWGWGGEYMAERSWNPFTDPAAMIQLIDGMRRKGWNFRLGAWHDGVNYRAEFSRSITNDLHQAVGATPMAAVAAAALAAVKNEVRDG